jgi:chromosome segregation ATPase
MGVDGAYLELLDSNLELRKKLATEETENISNKEKIRKLIKEIERCEIYINYLEKNLVSREDELERLKTEHADELERLKTEKSEIEHEKCKYQLQLKEETLAVLDNRIIQLEDTEEKLRTDINYLEINLASQTDEIERLKTELKRCKDQLQIKEEALDIQGNRIIQLEDIVERLRTDIGILISKNNLNDNEFDNNNRDMAHVNPDPIDRIINVYLPGIADRLQQI